MRRDDAPMAGWYPDPESRTNLRWWDGLDWTDARRAPPSQAELTSFENQAAFAAAHQYVSPAASAISDMAPGGSDPQQVLEAARRATRAEVDRAADLFARQARAMRQDFVPLISEYTNRLVRWIRFAVIVAIVLLVGYFVLQVVAQASLFEWIGDRIDNITEQNGAVLGTLRSSTTGS